MSEKVTRTPGKKARVGIRWRLFACLALFTALIIFVLWLFQVRLLSYFYEREKSSEVEQYAEEIVPYLSSAELETSVGDYAREKHICVRIFRIEGESAVRVADADVTPDCVIHHLGPDILDDLYKSARENGGTYSKRFAFDGEIGGEEQGRFPGFPRKGSSVNLIHVRLVQNGDSWYLMMLDMELTPVDATVRTLEMQFIWIAGILLAASLLLAFLLSHIVAKPLIDITGKAERLATGDYDVDFSCKGYKEVQELADTLAYAAGEIGATERLQRELIANISHDLRTPLTMIRGYGEMMRDIPGENTPENVQIVIDETARLTELVSDLMDLSKLQAGTLKPEPTTFDFTALLRDTMERYDALVRHRGYRIDLTATESAFVHADRTMILQVIYNLINNAVNYTGEDHRVEVIESVADGRVKLTVADSGEGIAPDKIDKIWDRYYRVDREHKRAVMGTGLGLSIVKSVLEAHKANYGVESAVGVGSRFWFELPLVDPPAEE